MSFAQLRRAPLGANRPPTNSGHVAGQKGVQGRSFPFCPFSSLFLFKGRLTNSTGARAHGYLGFKCADLDACLVHAW